MSELNQNDDSKAMGDGAEAPSPQLDLELRLQALTAEKAELQDLLLRRQADHENYRRRTERERGEIFEFASMEVVRGMLPIVDDFERALKVAPAAEAGSLRDYTAGVELIYQRLVDALTKLGLEPIEAAGKPFDPNLHHAVQKEPREDVPDHTVLEEYQRGYNFKGKLLRAAMVKVAVTP